MTIRVGDKVEAIGSDGAYRQGEVTAVYPDLDLAIVKVGDETFKIPLRELDIIEALGEKDKPISRDEFEAALNIVFNVFAEKITDRLFGGDPLG